MLKRLLLLFTSLVIEDAVEQDEIANSLITTIEEEEVAGAPEEVVESTVDTLGSDEATAEDLTWLPTEQERVFPDEVIERYAARYPELLAQLTDPATPEKLRQQVRQILHDKLNGDILLNRQAEADEEEEVVVVPAMTTALPTRQQWFDAIRQQVRAVQDPQLAKEFFTAFNKIWGADAKKMLAANPRVADEFTELLSVVAINLMKTHMHNLVWQYVPQVLESYFPGFGQMYERSANILAWDRVRNKGYSKLPAYGTREFSTRARQAATQYFGSDADFEHATFTKVVDGQRVALTPVENSEKKYGILARIMAGQNVDPGLIRQAVKTGAQQQKRRQAVRASGRLGAGTTRGQGATGGEDDLFTEGLKLYQREHGKL